MRILLPTIGVAAMLLSACQPDRTPATPAPAPAPSAAPTQAAAATPALDRDAAVMDYTCEGDHAVAIVAGGDIARVTLKEGRKIDLPRSADQASPLYAGEGLEFGVSSDGGVLDQDEIGSFACQPTD